MVKKEVSFWKKVKRGFWKIPLVKLIVRLKNKIVFRYRGLKMYFQMASNAQEIARQITDELQQEKIEEELDENIKNMALSRLKEKNKDD